MNSLIINDLQPSTMHDTASLQSILRREFNSHYIVFDFCWKNFPNRLHEDCCIVVNITKNAYRFGVSVEELFKTHPRAQSIKPVSYRKEIGPTSLATSTYIINWIREQMKQLDTSNITSQDTYTVF